VGGNDKNDRPGDAPERAAGADDAEEHSAPQPLLPPAGSEPLSRRSFLASTAAVVAATGVGLPISLSGAQGLDWNAVAKLSAEAFRVAVNEWIGTARVQGGKVSGAAAVLPPGSLVSDVNIEKRMVDLLASRQVPPAVAEPVAHVLAGAWHDWAGSFQMQVPGAYPTLAAVPARAAPPTRAAVSPLLSQGSSVGEGSLSAPILASRLIAALRMPPSRGAGASPDQAMQNLAGWVDGSFRQWKATVRMTSLIGKGPVPTYAPPYVPVGPVIRGETSSAGALFAGPRFGIVAP
jgi:hypothetical protein